MKYIIFIIVLFFIACGGSEGLIVDKSIYQKGYFGNPAIKGIGYECGDIKDITDDDGMFECLEFPVTFKIGNLTLGSIDKLTSDKKIYPQDIVGVSRSDFSDENVLNLTRLIQSLYSNENLEKETEIPKDISFVFIDEQNLSKLNEGEVKTLVEDSGKAYVDENTAIEKLKEGVEELVSITITPDNAKLTVGESVSFTAKGSFSNSTQKDITNDVVWSLESDDIAFLRGANVIGKSVGTVTLLATYEGIEKRIELTVSKAYLTQLDIDFLDKEIAEGSEMKLSAVGTFSDKSINDMTTLVVWSSSNKNLASVDNEGNVKALKSGKVTISIEKRPTLVFAPIHPQLPLTSHRRIIEVPRHETHVGQRPQDLSLLGR